MLINKPKEDIVCPYSINSLSLKEQRELHKNISDSTKRNYWVTLKTVKTVETSFTCQASIISNILQQVKKKVKIVILAAEAT